MAAIRVALFLLSITVGTVGGIRCYQCTYNDNPYGTGMSCVTPTFNDTPSVVDCETSCQLSFILNGDGSVFTLQRNCAVNDSISCCQNLNSQMMCSEICDNGELCNNVSYNASSSSGNYLPRCPLPVVDGSIPCYSCQYSGGNPDDKCVYDPDSAWVGAVQCPTSTSQCTIKSMRPIADPSYVWSYERGCHPIGSMAPYGQTKDSVYITWICYCNNAYCNNNTVDGTQAECHPQSSSGDGSGDINLGFSTLHQHSYSVVLQWSIVGLVTLVMSTSNFIKFH